MLMIHIKKYSENITHHDIPTERYDSLEISPVHIHKNKKCHKEAILALGDEIVTHLHSRNQLMKVEMVPEKAVVEQ
jgi:hypothetical protein